MNRPSHNGTYVSFHDATLNGSIVLSYDCGWSPNVTYIHDTIIIDAPYGWIPGHQYYVTLDSGWYYFIFVDCILFFVHLGASSGNDFCRKLREFFSLIKIMN